MRCVIIALIFASAVCHHFVSTSANSIKKEESTKTLFVNLSQKIKYLFDRVDKLAAKSSTRNNLIEKLVQQKQNFEDRFRKIENDLIKIEKCEEVQKCFNACDPNPCNGGRCEVLPDGSNYACTHCPVYTSGKNCENVKCNISDNCFKHNNKGYYVFETITTWEEAKRKCEDQGMTLAQPKDESTTQFLIDQMRPIYSYDAYKQNVRFWIGLNYNESGNQWQWTDGSALVGYTGGYADFKSNTHGQCGLLILYGGTVFWSPDSCLTSKDWYINYPVCEKRLSVI